MCIIYIRNIDLLRYNTEHTSTEFSAGGSLMYISQNLCYTLY